MENDDYQAQLSSAVEQARESRDTQWELALTVLTEGIPVAFDRGDLPKAAQRILAAIREQGVLEERLKARLEEAKWWHPYPHSALGSYQDSKGCKYCQHVSDLENQLAELRGCKPPQPEPPLRCATCGEELTAQHLRHQKLCEPEGMNNDNKR
jgi:hypothetical protein